MNPELGDSSSAEAVVPAFDQARVAVAEGSGVVARFPGLVAIYAGIDHGEQLERFIAICAEASADGGRAPGRRLARQLSLWLGAMEEIPALGTVAATEDGLAVFLTGGALLHMSGGPGPVDGNSSELSGADAAAWLDRVIAWPTGPFRLGSSISGLVSSISADDSRLLNLQVGVVRGGAVTVTPAGPVSPVVAVLAPPLRSALIADADEVEPPRPPLPIPGAAEPDVSDADPDGSPQVQGFLCTRGHLNDPRALFCGLCGIRMAERTGILTIGRRPPLGLLVFDDGTTFTVDSGYLLGREPESDERVKQGTLRPLVVIDTRGAVSRRHATLELDGWNVLLADAGSANGTFVAERGSESWSALVPQRPVTLRTGTRIRMGTRMFVFESPHGST
jgi:hypothetical protein